MDVNIRMSRSRLFVLIEAFERDMRDSLARYVLEHMEEPEALGVDYDGAAKLRASDSDAENASLADYLYLRQCFDILNRNRTQLPVELAEQLRQNSPRVDELAAIRNRVMHGRPLRSGDFDLALSIVGAFSGRYWGACRDVLERLGSDSSWEPLLSTADAPAERVLHNLPLADYDDTGLVGRGEELAALKNLILRGREAIVTVTGEGGIGKTALALEAAYAVVDDANSDLDCVLWVSMKTETLTQSGVQAIRDAIQDVSGVARELGSVFSKDFDGSLATLAEALSGLKTLIVIDNLESAQGDEVIRMYDALPSTVRYLFTSRVGLGQVERRIPLGPLKHRDAAILFKKLAGVRAPRLAALSAVATNQVLAQLRNSPLAIKWYVLSVEVGKEPVSTLRDQRELLAFCVQNVYEALSDEAQLVLGVLDAVARNLSFDELAVLTDASIDQLRRAAQELAKGSLVVNEADPDGGLVSRLGLSAAARMFLRELPDRRAVLGEIQDREEQYRRSAERRRADGISRQLGPNYVRSRSAEDEPVVHLLDLALVHSRNGNLGEAELHLERARAINAEYWEVDRVAGFIASTQRKSEEAVLYYRAAMENAQSEEEKAIVAHFLAGHLARGMHDLDGALEHASRAHSTLNATDTAIQLGNLHIWRSEFGEGQALIESILEDVSGRQYRIAVTSLVESWRRWGEARLVELNPIEAAEKCFAGFSLGASVVNRGYADTRLAYEVLNAATLCLRSMYALGGTVDVDRQAKMITWAAQHVDLVRRDKSWSRFIRATRVVPVSQRGELIEVLGNESSTVNGLVGEIVNWTGTFGFIRHSQHPKNVFFHRSVVENASLDRIEAGKPVRFDVAEPVEDDRPRATAVESAS